MAFDGIGNGKFQITRFEYGKTKCLSPTLTPQVPYPPNQFQI